MGTSQSIPGTTKYNFILPSDKPISPKASNLEPKLVTSNTSCKSLGDSIGLEFPSQNNITKIDLAINSVLTFTNKYLKDKLKSDQIVKMLSLNFDITDINHTYMFCKSLLGKSERPRRENTNYKSLENITVVTMCKKIISMVKLINKLSKKKSGIPQASPNENGFNDHCPDLKI